MISYFDKESYSDNYNVLTSIAKMYVYDSLKKQHKIATNSLDNFQKYKSSVKSLDEVQYYKLVSSDYKYIHSINVSKKCKKMAQLENISDDIMELIGLFHDVSHYSCDYKLHGHMSGEIAGEFFSQNSNFNEREIQQIKKIIKSHYPINWDEEYYLSDRISVEEIILLECDFWDKIDLASFSESTKIIEKSLIEKKYLSMQEKGNLLLSLPDSEQECVYTNSFRPIIKQQIEDNRMFFENI